MLVAVVALFFSLTGDPFAKSSRPAPVTGFDIKTVVSPDISMTANSEHTITGDCPNGSAAMSGGYVVNKAINSISVVESVPKHASHSWALTFYDPPALLGGSDGTVQAGVQCMKFTH
jgi:hypothetical protein